MIDRIHHAQEKLVKHELDALIISSAYNIAYLTGFFGFSKIEREGYVLLTANHLFFFASGLTSEAVAQHMKSLCVKVKHTRCDIGSHVGNYGKITLLEISPRTPLTKKALSQTIKSEKLKKLGFEKYNVTYAEFEELKKDLTVTLVPTGHLIEELRMIKTHDEIASIEKACKLGDRTFDYILKKIKPGITERQLAFEIELFIRKADSEISFPPIVAFGANSSVPHHVTNDKRLLPIRHSGKRSASRIPKRSWTSQDDAQIILLDFGVKIDNYCSDMTRTVFFGKATKEQRRMYQTVLTAQQKALDSLFMIPDSRSKHIKVSGVDKIARDYIVKAGFPTIPHSLGHGIGLEVHEPPSLSPKSTAILKPGMVFSIEPGIYIPNQGGIRIEDLFVLESSRPRILTKVKRELIEL